MHAESFCSVWFTQQKQPKQMFWVLSFMYLHFSHHVSVSAHLFFNLQLKQQVEGWAERVSELEAEMQRCEVTHSAMLQDVALKDERIMVGWLPPMIRIELASVWLTTTEENCRAA